MLGALGWYVNGTILKKGILPKGQMKLFDLLVPLLRLERVLDPPFGVSVISVCRRSEGASIGEERVVSAACAVGGNVL